MSYEQHLAEDARLVILKELAKQPGGSLNETLLARVLDTYGHRRSRDWLRTQLRKLDELGAIKLSEAGTVMIGEITRTGMDHVERRAVIDGVARPSPGA
ncbi:MAG: hypothetical protein IH590_00290 [Aquamicrobium sp.]|nr:hypothetical protein [Aquamicrobium sp.]